MVEKKYLNDDFEKIFTSIRNNENIVLFRHADGERSLMLGKPVHAQEGWISPAELTPLGSALYDTLDVDADNVYYGVSCPCCDRPAYYWYLSKVKSKNTTFSNIFVNKNYHHFISEFEKLTRDAVVIANHAGKNNKIGNLNVLKYYSIGDQGVSFFEDELDVLVDEIIKDFGDKNGLLYVFSAGPLSEIIIKRLYQNNPNNTYIDFGSSLDKYIHQKDTRPYTNPNSVYESRNCWRFDLEAVNFDVAVILTSYKNQDAIVLQLEALQKQTLTPKEIFLFTDSINGPDTNDSIKELLQKFDDVNVCSEVMDVWERLRYVKNTAKSNYICILDADVIPGISWLENCHYHMQENEGIYGTEGVILQKPEQYPHDGFFCLGWRKPYHESVMVDFVRQSWFFKKDWLEFMFGDTEEFQKHKYVAADMYISFKCKEHGIPTFVPPHPYWDLEQWGLKPESSMNSENTAISQNNENCINISNAISYYIEKGWNLVKDEESYSIRKLNIGNKSDYIKYSIIKILKKL